MAKKAQKLTPLTKTEIILRGDAEVIRQALEARTEIDTLLEEREAIYKRIAELETEVGEIVGEDGVFPFPEPPMPVASVAASPKKKAAPKPAAAKTEAPKKPAAPEAPAPEKPASETTKAEAPATTDETKDTEDA
jgi:hypothetical protein